MNIYAGKYFSPIGKIVIYATESELLALSFDEELERSAKKNEIIEETIFQLDEYFKGKRKKFNLKLKFNSTELQRTILEEVRKIPYGMTAAYSDIAKKIGYAKYARIIGKAMNNNSFPIIIPCHRVIGKNGKLTGYAYGLWRKEWLLLFEKQNLQEQKINSSDLLKSLRIINKTQKPT